MTPALPSTPVSPRILVIDDEPDLRALYELSLLREGYRVETAGSLAEARSQLASTFDVVITDMRLPDGLGMALLHELNASRRPDRIIVMTAYGSAENAVEALKAGAFDYLTKPVDLKQFRAVVASAIRDSGRAAEQAPVPAKTFAAASDSSPRSGRGPAAADLPEPGLAGGAALHRLVGESEAMLGVKRRIQKVASSMAPVLVRGESGTGKELIARAIHACSHRADGPFIAVNCGAIPENLLEAEFFGARKGAYTGSSQDRDGYFQAAQGGTLFLDEIGDLPLTMQSKLLRAVQERRVRAIGTTQEALIDVRFISATHKDLAAEVQDGLFRQDLYYRLNVIEIFSPALRERREDLPALCRALLLRIARESGVSETPTLSDKAFEQLQQLPLEGNVRELENLLHRALALNDGGQLDLDDLRPTPGDLTGNDETAEDASPAEQLQQLPHDLQAWLDRQERAILVRALNDAGFNRTAAAERLGLNLRQMRYRMSRLAIAAPATSGEKRDENG